jgi:hypothetical protein
MRQKNKVIIGLLSVAIVLFCAIQFWILPANEAKQAEFARNQTDALTHDISTIQDYKSPYVGNASNIGGLFENLPLKNVGKKYEIDSKNCILTVNYMDTVWNIGEEKVQRDLIYNSVAAMAAIDNLSEITYQFPGNSYSFQRKRIEEIFGTPLSDLLTPETWKTKVQNKLSSKEFCQQFYQ